jgi:hypothetical protein
MQKVYGTIPVLKVAPEGLEPRAIALPVEVL